MVVNYLVYDTLWFNRFEAEEAEKLHYAVFSRKSSVTGHEKSAHKTTTADSHHQQPATTTTTAKVTEQKVEKKTTTDEDDIDLFGSDDEEESAESKRIKEERVAMYADKKSKKEQIIAKSAIVLDVKPWDDETDLVEMERLVRSIELDGLLWGASRLVPLAYTIKKLQINCVVEDDKVGTDILEERITAFEDYVQSVDIASFTKI